MTAEGQTVVGQAISGEFDKGEAIVTGAFTRFAVPVKIPLLDTLLTTTLAASKATKSARTAFPEFKA